MRPVCWGGAGGGGVAEGWVEWVGGADAVAKRFVEEGCSYSSFFLHPRLARHRDGAPHLWRRRRVSDQVSQPYPGVLRRPHPGSHAFTFIGLAAGAEAGPGSDLEEELEEWEMEEEEEGEDGDEEEMMLDAGEEQDDDSDEVEAPREGLDKLDRDSLLAWMSSQTR